MKNIYILIFLLSALATGCKISQTGNSETPLFTVGDSPVFADEFLYVYQKNNFNDTLPPRASVDNYLDLFIKFKLKVKEARTLGLHNSESFQNEFNNYKEQLIEPYLTEKEVTEQLVKEAYDRLQQEVDVSHILIKISEPAEPEDTLFAYQKIEDIRQKAIEGDDFASLASEFSEDPSAAQNNGRLGYFTALQMVYPFEDMAYKTPEGEISPPFRSQFGYHILKVHDKRASQGQVKVAHIMIRATDGISPQDSTRAKGKIDKVYNLIQNGSDWDELCQQFSEDLNSKANGGVLPWIGTGNIYPSFEKAAFSLKEPGDIAEPIKTPYGWHVIKLLEKKGVEPYQEIKESLEKKVQRDSRSQLSQKALLKRLRKENEFKEINGLTNRVLDESDSSLLTASWKYDPEAEFLSEPIFSIKDSVYQVEDFYQYAESKQKTIKNITPRYYMKLLYEDYTEESLIAYEKAHLTEKYDDFRLLMKEYEEGILLFQLMDEKVWSKAAKDSAGLQDFYQKNQQNYQWDYRRKVVIYESADPDILERIKPYLENEAIDVASGSYKIEFDESTGEYQLDSSPLMSELVRKIKANRSYKACVQIDASQMADTKDQIIKYFTDNSVKPERYFFDQAEGEDLQIILKNTSHEELEQKFENLEVEEGIFEKGQNALLENIAWQKGTYELVKNEQHYLILVKEVLEPGTQQLEEVRGKVISDYQDHLEAEWVEELREKYSVEVNQKILENIYKKVEQKESDNT